MPLLVQGVMFMLIKEVEYWDGMDVEWLMISMLARRYFPFCLVRKPLYVIHAWFEEGARVPTDLITLKV